MKDTNIYNEIETTNEETNVYNEIKETEEERQYREVEKTKNKTINVALVGEIIFTVIILLPMIAILVNNSIPAIIIIVFLLVVGLYHFAKKNLTNKITHHDVENFMNTTPTEVINEDIITNKDHIYYKQSNIKVYDQPIISIVVGIIVSIILLGSGILLAVTKSSEGIRNIIASMLLICLGGLMLYSNIVLIISKITHKPKYIDDEEEKYND